MSNPAYFFEATQGVTDRLGELFDFAWPAAASMWNLRWQVQGFVAATSVATSDDLYSRFVHGSGLKRFDLRKPCLKATWQFQQDQLAKFVLFELCGLFESWLDDIVPRSVVTGQVQRTIKDLQFPTNTTPRLSGLGRAVQTVNARRSSAMVNEFYPVLKAHRKNSWSNIEDLLNAYRYFKTARNLLIHRGGVADRGMIAARTTFVGIPLGALHFKKAPEAPPALLGQPIRITLNDTSGLASIVHRIIATLDATMCVSDRAELELLRRLRETRGTRHMLPKEPAKRRAALHRRLARASLPAPQSDTETEALLKRHRLIS